ncbi:MAG: NAD(P)/FAD-dependent oxidoreductase, partial [Myxococcales bacterium]|nr:NAD(P)/FAD-dependent oxidoreductase [Myxococcales bacterium]
MTPTPPKRAIVIGAGIGGTATTALLSHAGLDTLLLEKNARLGGSCSYYEKRGFHIDMGTHLFCRGPKGPLGAVLRRVGRPDRIHFVRTRDIAEVRAAHWREDQEMVRIAVPAELHRAPGFFLNVAVQLKLTPAQISRAVRLFAHILTMSDREVEAWDHRTLDQFLLPFDLDPKTLSLFSLLLGLYFILPYWEISAGEALLCFRKMARDNHLSYPIGGAVAIPNAYCDSAREDGAEIRTGRGVKKIAVEPSGKGYRVVGVELDDGTFEPADVVVSTSSLRTTVLYMVGESYFPSSYVERVKRIRGSYIAVQAKFALDKVLVKAGALVGGVGDMEPGNLGATDMKQAFDHFLDGRLPEVTPLYCPVPTNFDPSLAPPGHQLLTVCALAPTSDVSLVTPAKDWEQSMVDAMYRVVPGLKEHTLFVDRFSVKFIEHWIGKEFGPAVSTGQTPDQVGSRRPPVRTP